MDKMAHRRCNPYSLSPEREARSAPEALAAMRAAAAGGQR